MDFLLQGGLFIWPIIIESVIGLWVIIERTIWYVLVLPARKKALNDLTENYDAERSDLKPNAASGPDSFKKALGKAEEERILNQSLLVMQGDNLVSEAEKNLSILNVIWQSAPLFGLLGTVVGMIEAFMEIQALGGQVNASDLAGGIWAALITTAAGLTVAIPALIAYIGFGRIVDRYAQLVEATISHIVHKFTKSGMEVV